MKCVIRSGEYQDNVFYLFKEDVLSYLPRSDCNPINFGSFEVHCLSTDEHDYYRLKELEIVGRVEWVNSYIFGILLLVFILVLFFMFLLLPYFFH